MAIQCRDQDGAGDIVWARDGLRLRICGGIGRFAGAWRQPECITNPFFFAHRYRAARHD